MSPPGGMYGSWDDPDRDKLSGTGLRGTPYASIARPDARCGRIDIELSSYRGRIDIELSSAMEFMEFVRMEPSQTEPRLQRDVDLEEPIPINSTIEPKEEAFRGTSLTAEVSNAMLTSR